MFYGVFYILSVGCVFSIMVWVISSRKWYNTSGKRRMVGQCNRHNGHCVAICIHRHNTNVCHRDMSCDCNHRFARCAWNNRDIVWHPRLVPHTHSRLCPHSNVFPIFPAPNDRDVPHVSPIDYGYSQYTSFLPTVSNTIHKRLLDTWHIPFSFHHPKHDPPDDSRRHDGDHYYDCHGTEWHQIG
jgi:hypothetical protein